MPMARKVTLLSGSRTGPVRPSALEARTKYHVRTSLDERLQKHWIVAWIVFQVRILNEQNVAGRGGQSLPDRMALSLRAGLKNGLNSGRGIGRVACDKLPHELAGTVGRITLDDNDLFRGLRKRLPPDALQKYRYGARFVENSNDDRYFHGYLDGPRKPDVPPRTRLSG